MLQTRTEKKWMEDDNPYHFVINNISYYRISHKICTVLLCFILLWLSASSQGDFIGCIHLYCSGLLNCYCTVNMWTQGSHSEHAAGVPMTNIVYPAKTWVSCCVILVFRQCLSSKVYLQSKQWCPEKAMVWITRFYNTWLLCIFK